jgi:hypothetical protein
MSEQASRPLTPERVTLYSKGNPYWWDAAGSDANTEFHGEPLGEYVRADVVAALLVERERLRETLQAADKMRDELRWFAMRQWPYLLAPEQDGIAFIRRSGAASAAIEDYDRAGRALAGGSPGAAMDD